MANVGDERRLGDPGDGSKMEGGNARASRHLAPGRWVGGWSRGEGCSVTISESLALAQVPIVYQRQIKMDG